MSSKTKTFALAFVVGSLGGCFLTGGIDALRAGNNLLAAALAVLLSFTLMVMGRVVQRYGELKGGRR